MKKVTTLLIIFLFASLLPLKINASEKIQIYLFHSDTCPHCKDEIEFLNKLEKKYDIEIIKYEVSNEENSQKMSLVKQAYNIDNPYVPFTTIGTVTFTGFNEEIGSKIENAINYYLKNPYRNLTKEILEGNFKVGDKFTKDEIKADTVTIPIFGEINPKSFSLPLIAMAIGTVDGFNPCAMWVLLFLISMLIGMKDKKKMWILGSTFLITSALVYLLLMVSWLQISLSIIQISYVRLLIAIFAIAAGLWNLNKFRKSLKEDDGCEVVSKEKRIKIFDQVKKISTEKTLILSMLGVIALAISVNVVELACSAGLPLIFTQILAVNSLSPLEYSIYILIYILFFLIDDIIIFIIAIKTFETVGMSNKYSKLSTLIGGAIMLIIGILLIIAPNLLMFA